MSDEQIPAESASVSAASSAPDTTAVPAAAPAKKAAAKKAAKKAPAKKTAKKSPAKKTAAKKSADPAPEGGEISEKPKKSAAKAKKSAGSGDTPGSESTSKAVAARAAAPMVLFQTPEKSAGAAPPARKRTAKKSVGESSEETGGSNPDAPAADGEAAKDAHGDAPRGGRKTAQKTARKGDSGKGPEDGPADESGHDGSGDSDGSRDDDHEHDQDHEDGGDGEGGAKRRPRRRGGRRRRKSGGEGGHDDAGQAQGSGHHSDDDGEDDGNGEGGSRRRRTRNRAPKSLEDEIASVSGSTRLEAKKQRRREGREAGRRRAPIVSEAEFLARREAVDRTMVIRQRDDLTQIGVLEDKVLVEHYVSRASQTSLIGNIYLGRVQNVLPSMEAAFVDIGKGRNAVIYAGEVNWSGMGHKEGQPRKIESVLSSGQTILVQVSKDPIGHKGARLTGQISLPGRFLVYVPDGNTSGISRKLPDTERNRLKALLKQIVPDTAGVIVRTAAEGASEAELTQDVERLTARWADIEAKVKVGKSPELLYGEPDLTLKVVRDLFTEDFVKLVVQGDEAWDLVDGYVSHVAPDLRERLEKYDAAAAGKDLFTTYRVDEQIAKGLDRKVWLPSGGSLVIDRTEAMTVVDVNTGKFTGSGGNLEETVTKNNLEAAEEIVRQLRLRDIGGIIVVDFIDMVLESNRDLVLRRLIECLGRDRTRHQVAEVTSLGLVQMTRKRIGTGLLEAFSEDCVHCKGRGVVVHEHPVETAGASAATDDESRGRRSRGGRNRGRSGGSGESRPEPSGPPSPKDLAAIRPHPEAVPAAQNDDEPEVEPGRQVESPVAERAAVVAEPVADAVEPAEPPATPQPVVVTSRRRRTATRPAGQPEPVAVQPVVVEPVVVEPDAEVAETAPTVVEPIPTVVEPVETPAPIVVTSTRRRTASRPAGPPTTASGTDADDSTEAALEGEDQGSILHVPVKKKGTRKR